MVHLWLFKAINNRAYQRPLNWMMSYYKNTQEISNASKKGWKNLKNNEVKYKEFCKKRSDIMKSLSPQEQSRRANIFWDNITTEEYLKFSEKIKEYWTEERKEEKSTQMNEYYSNPENILKKSIESKNIWDSRSEKERNLFSEKMLNINKGIEKRKDASEKIKKLWCNEEYLAKMKKRPKNPGLKLKIIKEDGTEIIVDNMITMNNEYNFSSHLIRKYRDKGIKILEKDLKEENYILLNCIIESIK